MISGVVVPTLTPMKEGAINPDGLAELVRFFVHHEVGALFVNGTTGEGPLLSLEERRDCAAVAIESAAGRLPVIVQVGAATTQDSLSLALHAAEVGADALACITPAFFAYSDRELLHFYRDIARAAAPTALYLYSIPARTGNRISVRVAEQLAKESNVVGIKDSSGDMAQLLDYLSISDFAVLPGADLLATPALVAGAKGIVSGPANVFPELYMALWRAWERKDYEALLRWQGVIMQVSRLVAHGGRLDLLKGLMAGRVASVGEVRPPLVAAGEEELSDLRGKLRALLAATSLQEDAYTWL